jgi:hypothetical protein
LGDFLKKIAPKSFGRYFSEQNAPNAKKYRPNGEISPNLVTPNLVSALRQQSLIGGVIASS